MQFKKDNIFTVKTELDVCFQHSSISTQ